MAHSKQTNPEEEEELREPGLLTAKPRINEPIFFSALPSAWPVVTPKTLPPMWPLNSKLCSQTGNYSEILVYLGKGVKNSPQSLTFHSSQTSHSGWVPRALQLRPLAGWRCAAPPAYAKKALSSQNLCMSRKFVTWWWKKEKRSKELCLLIQTNTPHSSSRLCWASTFSKEACVQIVKDTFLCSTHPSTRHGIYTCPKISWLINK